MARQVLVIGAGLAGISKALSEWENGSKVTIAEKSGGIGGLLTSFRDSDGLEFPIGTHFLNSFNNDLVNKVLYDGLDWKYFDYIKMGHIANGKVDTETGFLDISALAQKAQIDYYLTVTKRILRRNGLDKQPSLSDYLRFRHGKIVAGIFDEIALKRFGESSSRLAVDSLDAIVLTHRVKAFSPKLSRVLKRYDYFNQRLAFHSCREGRRSNKSFVPSKARYKAWWSFVKRRLEERGICVLNNAITTIADGRANILQSGSVTQLPLDSWDIVDSVGITTPQEVVNYEVRTNVSFFVSDQTPCVDCHYITNYDPTLPFTRLTLCDNIWDRPGSFVVENVYPGPAVDWGQSAISAVKNLGIYEASATIRKVGSIEMLNTGFRPKLLRRSISSGSGQVGIAAGKSWFMHEHV